MTKGDKQKKVKLINHTKDFVAKSFGYEEGILGSSWDYAMQITHRTKKQILLYERVIDLLSEAVNYSKISL